MVVETARAHASVTSNLMECYEAVGTALDSFHSVVICVCVFFCCCCYVLIFCVLVLASQLTLVQLCEHVNNK